MEIFRRLAGYTLGQADLIRRAISKKKADVLLKEKEKFVLGCEANNIAKEIAVRIFDEIEDFASYAFNKSHAACYSVVAYQTAYLKCYYPSQFYAALISSNMYFTEKVAYYIQSARSLGIHVLAPRINSAKDVFSVRNSDIIFGFNAIKGVGKNISSAIMDERISHGEFTSFENFVERMANRQLNKRALESLIMAGCFDEFGRRSEFLKGYEFLLEQQSRENRFRVTGQLELFALQLSEPAPKTSAVSEKKIYPPTAAELKMEKEVLGLYLSGHPLEEFRKKIRSMRLDSVLPVKEEFLEQGTTEKQVKFVGVISNLDQRRTKTGKNMAFFTLEDLTGSVECIAFPTVFVQNTDAIVEDNIIVVSGKLSLEADDAVKLIVEEIGRFSTDLTYLKLYLRLPSETSPKMEEVKRLLKFFSGETPVYVYFEEQKRLTMAPKDLWITENSILLEKLEQLLGASNVKLVTE